MSTRIVVMSDIHGNLPALEAVRDALPPNNGVYVAGDLCLDGPCPAQVLDLLDELGWNLLMGNTDRDIARNDSGGKGKKARLLAWTREILGPPRLERLGSLPFELRFEVEGDRALVVHANPIAMDDHLPPDMSEEELRLYLERVHGDILCFGHLHIPYIRPVDGILLVDVSSVGHPKDRDRRAAFTVFEWEGGRRSVTQVRVPYDIERTVELMRASGMPDADEHAAELERASY